MFRLCLTLGISCLILGCSGPSLEGTWYGPLPIGGGQDCRIRLLKAGRFEFSCTSKQVGEGKYLATPDQLSFEFDWLAKDGERTVVPSPITMGLNAGGNTIELKLANGELVRWERRLRP